MSRRWPLWPTCRRSMTNPRSPPARARGRRGHGHADEADADWRPTAERFRDPRTNQVMRVWEDAAGGRHYVPDG